jgi:hypothetical protein
MARLASGDPEPKKGTFKGSLQSIADYIPSEGLGVYLAAQGLLIPAKDATDVQVFRLRLVCFAIGMTVVGFLAFAAFDGSKFASAEAWRRRTVVTILAVVAFVIYGAATPLFFLSGQTYLTIAWSQWAAIVTIISALVLPYVANVLNIKAPKPKRDPPNPPVA